jgi:NitT/TauT family transport system substrate-binding protein
MGRVDRGFRVGAMASLLAAGLLVAIFSSHRATGQSPEHLALRLDWLATATHMPIFLAAARGYYRDEGIDLEILDGKGSLATIQSVAAGSDRIGIASLPNMAIAVSKGLPLVAIAGFIQKAPDAVIALKGSGITQPKDVEGKRWGVVPDASFARTFPAFAAANGIDMGKIVKVQMSSATVFSALLQGNVDFVTGWASNDALRIARQKPIEPPIVFADHGVNILGTGFIVTVDTAARDGRLLRGFLAATVRGAKEAAASPEAGLEAVAQARPATDRALLAEQVTHVAEFQRTKNSEGHGFGWMAKADWDETLDLLEKYFDLPKGIDASRVYTNEFLPKQ